MASSKTDILIIGHVTRDLITQNIEDGYRLGGTSSFGAITSLRLNRVPAIVTGAQSPNDLAGLPSEIESIIVASPHTTTFANVYNDEGRIQYCYAAASTIVSTDIPSHLHNPSIVLLGPLVNEIGTDIAPIFSKETLVAAVPQGWMRHWDETGRVFSKLWDNAEEILSHLDVLVLSLEDIDYDMKRLERFFEYVPLIVVTEYRDGSTLYQSQPDGRVLETKIPPRPAIEVDPTGAGDVFATAFLIRLQEIDDPIAAARFANVTASIGVESEGVTGIPTREQVLTYMDANPVEVYQQGYYGT
ncbi:MAG: PfkB family carbohydrate kinase [Chloroflexota bacterium]